MKRNTFIAIAGIIFLSGTAHADNQKINAETQTFSVTLGGSRVIYDPDSAGATLTVSNPQHFPMLVQSDVYAENRTDPAPFVVTPPLFRLDGQRQNRLRIVSTEKNPVRDRESLYWLCVTGIPPEPGEVWSQNKKDTPRKTATLLTQVRLKSCIKMFVRPPSLKGEPVDMAASLTWQKTGSTVTVNNPGPFYINLKTARIGDAEIKDVEYIPPFGSRSFSVSGHALGPATWSVVTDFGGVSREYQAPVS